MSTVLPMYEWKDLPWKSIERKVFKLQKRIFQASANGNGRMVRKLQRLLVSSRSSKLLAVRRITQDNQGKKTAGIDGVKALNPRQRFKLADFLSLNGKAAPVRRVWIPKPGTDEKRGLGIPTMRDRATQTLVKFALEPEWEARFEPNSYGFRPGRSCWDAIEQIYLCIKTNNKWVLDADIAKCFDRINHDALLKKVNTSPRFRRQIKAWLKAGVMDGGSLFPSEEGTPQGGAISPLLANIALHGIEQAVQKAFPERRGRKRRYLPNLVRYADDLVCLHADREVVRGCQEVISECIASMGLELKPSKTRIVHTLNKTGEFNAGFDFLGFTIRQFRGGKYRTGKDSHGRSLGFKTLITPSREGQKRHGVKLREIVKRHQAQSQGNLIQHLNPLIRGWSNYYKTVCSKETFVKMYNRLHWKLMRWAKKRHSKKTWGWVTRKYWRGDRGRLSRFAPKDAPDYELIQHSDTKIVRHVKVKESRSPFDGDWVYWRARLGSYPGVEPGVAKLLHQQQGKCSWCGSYLHSEDVIEVDHKVPKKLGGTNERRNLQILHRHCHDVKTTEDLKAIRERHAAFEAKWHEGEHDHALVRPGKVGDEKPKPKWDMTTRIENFTASRSSE